MTLVSLIEGEAREEDSRDLVGPASPNASGKDGSFDNVWSNGVIRDD
jgi:hypothetical protein